MKFLKRFFSCCTHPSVKEPSPGLDILPATESSRNPRGVNPTLGLKPSVKAPLQFGILDSALRGTGISNEFTYEYALKDYIHCGVYSIAVGVNLLLGQGEMLLTESFMIGHTKWRVELKHGKDNLRVFIVSENSQSLKAYLTVSMISQIDAKKSLFSGTSTGSNPGDKHFITRINDDVIRDATKGYISHGCFELRFVIRIKVPRTEKFLIYDNDKTAYFTWCLKDLAFGCPFRISSETFKIGKTSWNATLWPKGSDYGGNMKVLLSTADGSKKNLKYSIAVLNHRQPAASKVKNGWTENKADAFVEDVSSPDAFEDPDIGFLNEGWITLAFHVMIDPSESFSAKNSAFQNPPRVRILSADLPSSILHMESILEQSICTVEWDDNFPLSEDISYLSKIEALPRNSIHLSNFWLCKELQGGSIKLIQRVDLMQIMFSRMEDLQGTGDNPITFLMAKQGTRHSQEANLDLQNSAPLINLFSSSAESNPFCIPYTSSSSCGLPSNTSVPQETLCTICEDRPITYGFVHLDEVHRCVCKQCAVEIRYRGDPCPLCGKQIEGVQKVVPPFSWK